MLKYYIGAAIVGAVFVGAMIAIFFESGGPLDAKGQKYDQERVRDIQSLKYSVEDYYRENGKLPDKLSGITLKSYQTDRTNDPETGKEYEYSATGDTSYKICATFSTSSSDKKSASTLSYNNEFNHPKGYHCFNLKLSKSIIESQQKEKYQITIVNPDAGERINSPVTFTVKTTSSSSKKVKAIFEKWNGKSWEELGETEFSVAGSEQSITLPMSNGSFYWRAKICDLNGICGAWSSNRTIYVTSTKTN